MHTPGQVVTCTAVVAVLSHAATIATSMAAAVVALTPRPKETDVAAAAVAAGLFHATTIDAWIAAAWMHLTMYALIAIDAQTAVAVHVIVTLTTVLTRVAFTFIYFLCQTHILYNITFKTLH